MRLLISSNQYHHNKIQKIVAYMETVSTRLEVCYRDFKDKEQRMNHELQQAGNKITILEAELRDANKKIRMLEARVACPSKIRLED